MRVACYLRVSTEDQKTDLQRDAIENYCKLRGWHAPALFVDQGESGAKTSRPEFDRMMSDVRGGLFDVVLTWKFDRIGRSTSHLISVLDELQRRGVAFVSVTESIDTTTPMGKMIFTVFAALAEFERETLIMRTKAGLEAARTRGAVLGAPTKVTDEQRRDILYLKGQGMSLDDIHANFPRLSRSTVYRITKGAL
jgi:DNA invertase Pin-like site-specific DNA recombinase